MSGLPGSLLRNYRKEQTSPQVAKEMPIWGLEPPRPKSTVPITCPPPVTAVILEEIQVRILLKRVDLGANLEQWSHVVYQMRLIASLPLVISNFAMRMKGLEPSRHKDT